MKEKKRTEVCEGEKDEKGTKWKGRKPMNPNLILKTLASLVEHVRAVCAPKLTTDSNEP